MCEDVFMSAMSRGLEDHKRIGGTCGRKFGTQFQVDSLGMLVLPLQVSLGHWRRLGKLFVHGQLRQTFLPEAEDDLQVLHILMLVCMLSRCRLFIRFKRSCVPTAWRMERGSLPRDSAQTAGS